MVKRVHSMPSESDQRILSIFGLTPDDGPYPNSTLFRRGNGMGSLVYLPEATLQWGVCWSNGIDDAEMCWCRFLDTALRVLVRLT